MASIRLRRKIREREMGNEYTNSEIRFRCKLAPFSFLYGIGVWLRNLLFDWDILPSERFPIPVICIGNLSVGGTGKTPHTEYLIRLLKTKYRVAVLSRGYKRRSSGFLLATSTTTERDLGDEPYQMKYKFPDVLVAVDADRRRGIWNLLRLPENERPEVILLDDAFQHRYVSPSFSIMLTDVHRLFYKDRLLPVGLLREPSRGVERADVVIVTRCETGMKPIDFRVIENNMSLQPWQQLFFTRIVYDEIMPVFPTEARSLRREDINMEEDILVIAGIASPDPFIREVKRYSGRVVPILFPDHHVFSMADFRRMEAVFGSMHSEGKLIIVTEKDAARLRESSILPSEWRKVLYCLPIKVEFYNRSVFDEKIEKHLMDFCRQKGIKRNE